MDYGCTVTGQQRCRGFQNLALLKPINRRFEFHKRRQLFIRTHNEPLAVVAVRVSNPDRSPTGIMRVETL